jgi:uncharacterized protein (DUF305 family)
MKERINSKLIIVGLLSFILGAGIMHFSGREYMDHGMRGAKGENMSEMQMGKMDSAWPDGSTVEGDGNMMMKKDGSMSMESMMMSMNANLKGKSGKELEKAFLTEMIPHHEGAIVMAQAVLADPSARTDLRKLATDIVLAQENEIAQMKKWLAEYK